MEVEKFQKTIVDFSKKWQKKRHYSPDEHFTFIHLTEEVGELAEQYVSQRIRKDKFDKDKLDNAIADIFMQTVALAQQRGLDIEELVTETIIVLQGNNMNTRKNEVLSVQQGLCSCSYYTSLSATR